jgi:hypothetical protein
MENLQILILSKMVNIEEKILKAIKKHFYNVDGTPDKSAKEINEMTHKHYMEFCEWLDFGTHNYYLSAEKDQTYYREGSHKIYTIEEVYQYWLTNNFAESKE